MSSKDEEVSQVPDQLITQLLSGYDSLLLEFKTLNDQHRELNHKLAWAKQQYSDILKRYCPDKASVEQKVFLDELEEAGACERNGQIDWLECLSTSSDTERRTRAFTIRVANDAREKLQHRQGEIQGVKIWRNPEKRGSTSSRIRSELERDYTTPGTPSRLGCPFAAALGENNPCRPSTLGGRSLPTPRSSASRASGSLARRPRRTSLPLSVDPIQAELCGNDPTSPAISAQGSSAVCPIRFLDQHSPEEVAQYFERHKHEIPRSHEICVKRYQSNAEQIKQLDAKYGNLVSMIQGLGEKHQPWLPEKTEEELQEPPEAAVTQWAKNVSAGMEDQKLDHKTAPEDEERVSHFERQLKEVRVGESPSRPWGISVPSKFQRAESVSSRASGNTASPQELSAPEPLPNDPDNDIDKPKELDKKCPFDHSKLLRPDKLPAAVSQNDEANKVYPHADRPILLQDPQKYDPGPQQASSGQASSRMVFTGPVFIGYSMDQALNVLRESGIGSK